MIHGSLASLQYPKGHALTFSEDPHAMAARRLAKNLISCTNWSGQSGNDGNKMKEAQ